MKRSAILVSLAVLSGVSCVTTRLVETWNDSSYRAAPLRKVVVYVRADRQEQAQWGQVKFAQTLSEYTNAVSYADVFSEQDISKLPKDKVRAALLASGFDGFLVTGLTSIKQHVGYVPGQIMNYGLWGAPSWGWGYGGWGGLWMTPGYTYVTNDYYVLATLYDVRSGKMVWRAQSVADTSPEHRDVVEQNASLFTQNLAKAGVISK